MNLTAYQSLSQAFSQWRPGYPEYRRVAHRQYAHASLFGEAGELVGIVKKSTFSGHAFDRTKFIDEAGDVAWSIACLADAYDVPMGDGSRDALDYATPLDRFIGRVSSCILRAQNGLLDPSVVSRTVGALETLCRAHDVALDDALASNLAKLAKRYPSGAYSNADSIARRDEVSDVA